jgi:hypothetical protein
LAGGRRSVGYARRDDTLAGLMAGSGVGLGSRAFPKSKQ